jgi:hypothetical protein
MQTELDAAIDLILRTARSPADAMTRIARAGAARAERHAAAWRAALKLALEADPEHAEGETTATTAPTPTKTPMKAAGKPGPKSKAKPAKGARHPGITERARAAATPELPAKKIVERVMRGWTFERASTEPVNPKFRHSPRSKAKEPRPPLDDRPLITGPAVAAKPGDIDGHTILEHGGEKLPVHLWASRRGDTTSKPLLAQLRAGMSMDEAMRMAHASL